MTCQSCGKRTDQVWRTVEDGETILVCQECFDEEPEIVQVKK